MQHAPHRRLTGIDVLVLAIILCLLAITLLLPGQGSLVRARDAANAVADARNLFQIGRWLELARSRGNLTSNEGGHEFLLMLWTNDLIDHCPANFDRFFTPGIDDPHVTQLRAKLVAGDKIWPHLNSVTPDDTHYAARAKEHFSTMFDKHEAWAANDNEGGWAFQQCVVNILWGDGSVQTLTLSEMKEQFGLRDEQTEVFKTWGKDSPHPALQKLKN